MNALPHEMLSKLTLFKLSIKLFWALNNIFHSENGFDLLKRELKLDKLTLKFMEVRVTF